MSEMRWIGISRLRNFDFGAFRQLNEPVEIRVHKEPLAVLIPYTLYLQWQELSEKIDELERKLEEN